MTRVVSPTASLLACVAVVLAAANWWALNMVIDISPLAGEEPRAAVVETRGDVSLPEAAQAPPDAGRESQSRPLFRSSRRPVEEKGPEAAALEAGPRPEGVELAGVMREPGRASRALIRSASAPSGEWVEIGHSVAGWRLAEIDEDSAVFEADGRRWRTSLFPDRSP